MAPLTRSMKKKKDANRASGILSLPNDILVEVLANVGSSSFDDLYAAKLSCKDFNQLGQDGYIFRSVCLKKFPLVPWITSKQRSKFLSRCRKYGNAEALYRKGVSELFSGEKITIGIACLKEAMSKGHVEAMYVYGAILVCCGGDLKQEGLELLYSLNEHKKKGLNITECRGRVKKFICSIWADRDVVTEIVETYRLSGGMRRCRDCGDIQDVFTIDNGWDYNDHDKFSDCNSCRWHQEVSIFCEKLMLCNFKTA